MARVKLTAKRVQEFTCPPGKAQAFLWSDVAGLALRATPSGAKAYIYQAKFQGRDLRLTIGSPAAWTIPAAEREARRLQTLIDQGRDPRIERAATVAASKATREAEKAERLRQQVTGLDAWKTYCEAKHQRWGELSRLDHERAVQKGGEERKRAKERLTQPGPLRALLARPLAQLDADTVAAWVKVESKQRPTVTAKNFRLLRAFINWCTEHDEYRLLVQSDACKQKKTREHLQKPQAKRDVLLREQLPAWFAAVQAIPNSVQAAYLQCLLLCGCRPGEMLELHWEDIGVQWRSLTIRDKVEGERTIPLTPYVHHLLAGLPRRNGWVFCSTNKSESGRMSNPAKPHARACAVAGLDGLTLHGLRRSFKSLTEWLESPAGVVAQLQGHKPSATAEKHYTVRPLDLLRVHHERIEQWILQQASVPFDASQAAPGALRLVP